MNIATMNTSPSSKDVCLATLLLSVICGARIRRFFIVFCVFCAVLPQARLRAQTLAEASERQWRVGILGGFGELFHFSSLPLAPPDDDCCRYRQGVGGAWQFGVSLDYSPVGDALEIGSRIIVLRSGLALEETVRKFERFDGLGGYQTLERLFQYRSFLHGIDIDFGVRYKPWRGFPLYARVSADALAALDKQNPAFETERILAPSNAVYPNRLQTRDNPRAPAEFAPASFGVSGALGLDFEVGANVFVGAEASYRYALSSLRSDIDWQMNAVRAALFLRFGFNAEPAPLPLPTPEQPSERRNDNVLASEQTRKTRLKAELTAPPLELQETVVTETFPLLPYIFFDSASVIVRNKYNPRNVLTSSFSEEALPKETLEIYYHILHIVGKRMRENPSSRLTITGATDGKEWATAETRQILALQRARSVASFLTGYWGIDAARIDVATRDTPKLASSSRYAEGDEENRRVELSSDNPNLLGPVVHSRFLEYAPLAAEYTAQTYLREGAPEEVSSYDASLRAGDVELARSSGLRALPARISFPIAGKKFAAALARIPVPLPRSATLRLGLSDGRGEEITTETAAEIRIQQNSYEKSRLNLIVFDFDRDDMLEANRAMMRRFVGEAVKNSSRVRLIGSTDRLGEARYNQELSEARVRGVQDFMRRLNPNIRFAEVRGIGASLLPFDNNLPEGRYYCRTVGITVETPRE